MLTLNEVQQKPENNPKLEEFIQKFQLAFQNQNLQELIRSLKIIRAILSEEQTDNEIFENMVKKIGESDIIQQISHYIKPQFKNEVALQKESMQIFSILLATNQEIYMKKMLDQQIVPLFFNQFESDEIEIREFAIYCVANIVGDNKEYKKQMIQQGLIEKITETLVKKDQNKQLLENLAFLLNNILDQSDGLTLNYKKVEPLIPLLQSLIQQNIEDNNSVAFDLFSALSGLTENRSKKSLEKFIQQYNGIILKTIQYLKKMRNKGFHEGVMVQAFYFLENITYADDEDLMQVVQLGLHELAYQYTTIFKDSIKEVNMRIIKNLCKMQSENNQILYDHHTIILEIIRCAEEEKFNVKRQAIQALASLYNQADQKQADLLVKDFDTLEIMANALNYNDADILEEVLNGLEMLFYEGEDKKEQQGLNINYYSMIFEKRYNGFSKIDKIIMEHQQEEIVKIATEIYGNYYQVDFQDLELQDEKDEFFNEGFDEYTEINGVPFKDLPQEEQQSIISKIQKQKDVKQVQKATMNQQQQQLF
ncbi:Armadillo-type fold [Pseudocohnilembus persalinus]|uniref:Armadillo-type fold n=1 Tax=Pseudocohnilembus persalinus TaxID=266149 RepID=A0A0V0QBH3_PSEPJ|nr:Armadillo-type fold [Pseudocohnilembus persalinus]|eukprot:KRW99521.1 Armadillo-type fold [Pseudocohnilembus persalinus]